MGLYLLVDEIAERFLTVVDRFDDDIDQLEDNVGVWPSEEVRRRISSIRHEILEVRRVLTPSRDAARAVLDDRVEIDGDVTLFPREIELHFADAYDKLLRATDGLDLARDLLAGVRDFHQAQVANDQNEVMKRLTVVASVLLRADVHRRAVRPEPARRARVRLARTATGSRGRSSSRAPSPSSSTTGANDGYESL